MAPQASQGGGVISATIIKNKTADYQVLVSESGVFFTSRGAGSAVTFTLPAVTNLPIGVNFEFFCLNAAGIVIASSGSLDNISALNDLTADTLTFSTTSRMIGAYVKVMWDGTSWCAIVGAGATNVVA